MPNLLCNSPRLLVVTCSVFIQPPCWFACLRDARCAARLTWHGSQVPDHRRGKPFAITEPT